MEYTSISLHLEMAFWFVILGVAMGICFDIYRVLRGLIKPNRFMTVIGDLMFWIFITVMVFAGLVFKNWGNIRGYTFMGIFCGFLLYKKTVSRLFVTGILKTVYHLKIFFKTVVRAVVLPIVSLGQKLMLPVRVLSKSIKKAVSIPVRIKEEARRMFPKVIRK